MTSQDELLARLLAQVDAVHLPQRDPRAASWAATCEARRGYIRSGIPWRSEGTGPAEWKEGERGIRELARQGLVRLPRRGAMKTLSFRLTERGDQQARSLTGMGGVEDAKATVLELLRLDPAGGWIAEIKLNGGNGWGDGRQKELTIIEDLSLSALASGWIEANCDMIGHVYYRSTARGRAEAPTAEPLPGLPDEVPGLAQFHADEMGRALERLRSVRDRGTNRDIGGIPLPVSMPA